MKLVVTSFSFKRGIPAESNLVFDVRFLKNPHYDPELQPLSGLDEKVGAYIEANPDFAGFFSPLTALLEPLLPCYAAAGNKSLTIAIGCTGGQHRSVYVAQKLGGFLHKLSYNVTLRHRDLEQK